MNNILDILHEYSKKHLIVDKDFLIYVVNNYVKCYNLEEYVKDIAFSENDVDRIIQNFINNNFLCQILNIDELPSINKEENCFMLYMDYPRIIYIDMSKINYETIHLYFKNCDRNYFSSSYNLYLFYNSIILIMILHELHHAKQHKDSKDRKNNSFENQLLKLSFWTDDLLESKKSLLKMMFGRKIEDVLEEIRKKNQIENICYKILPYERLANYYAQEKVISLVSELENIEEVLKLLNQYSVNNNLKEYIEENDYSPTINYLNIIDSNELAISKKIMNKRFLKKFKDELNTSVENRLKLGLYLSPEEIDEYKRKVLL